MLTKAKVSWKQCTDLAKAMPDSDVVYMTRVQKERFPILSDYNRYHIFFVLPILFFLIFPRVKDLYIMDEKMMSLGRKNMILMHPLPSMFLLIKFSVFFHFTEQRRNQ